MFVIFVMCGQRLKLGVLVKPLKTTLFYHNIVAA